MASASGAVYPFGDAPNDGGMAGTRLNGAIIVADGFLGRRSTTRHGSSDPFGSRWDLSRAHFP